MRLPSICLLALLAAACATDAGVPPPSPGPHLPATQPPLSSTYRSRSLATPAGLRACALEVKSARSASLLLAYTLAGVPDPAGKEGLAQLSAAAANRAAARGGLGLGERLFAAGALFSADADDDALRFQVRVRPDRLAAVLAVEADRARDPAAGLTDAELVELRDRVAARLEDAPRPWYPGQLRAELLPGTRYGAPPATAASMRAITPADVRAFLREVVRPARAVVVLASPLPAEKALESVEATFSGLPFAAPPPTDRADPPAVGAAKRELRSVEGRVDAPELWMAWTVPGARARTAAAAGIAAPFLARVLRGRAHRDGLDGQVARVDAWPVQGELAGLLVARVRLEEGADAEAVRTALGDAAAEAGEVWRVTRWSNLGEVQESIRHGVARDLEAGALEGLDLLVRAGVPDPVDDLDRQAQGMTGDVPLLFEQRVRLHRPATLLVRPAARAEPAAAPGEIVPAWGRAPDLFALAAPGARDAAALASGAQLGTGERRTLPNGLRVVVLPRGDLPLVNVELHVAVDTERRLSRDQTRVALDALARSSPRALAWYRFVPGGVRFRARGQLSALPRLLAEVGGWTWVRPSYVKTLQVASDLREAEEAADGETREALALRDILEAGLTTPDGVPSAPDAVSAVSARVASDALPRWFRPERATLVVTGKVEPSEALWNDVADAFGRWRGAPEVLAESPEPAAPQQRRVLVLDHPGALTGHVTVAFRTPRPGRRDEAAHLALVAHLDEVADQIAVPVRGEGALGGHDGARLSYLLVGFSGKRGEVPGAVRALLGELDAMRSSPLSGPSVDFARWNAARWTAYRHDDLDDLASALGERALLGIPDGAEDGLGAALGATTPATLHAYAREVLGRELVVVSGDATSLVPALEKLGLDPRVIPAAAPSRL